MGTLATAGNNARIKFRDTNSLQFSDTQLISLVNTILEDIYQTLVNVSSNLVYAVGTVTTVASTAEYTPDFTHNGFLRDGSWVDGEDTYLQEVSEADKIKWDYDSTTSQPEAYYLTEDGKVGYLWVPDDAYTIYHTYWKPITAMSTYATDTLPWGGIFNRFIERMLIVECLEILERDSSRQAVLAEIEHNKVMNLVFARGVRREKQVSNMFGLGGI